MSTPWRLALALMATGALAPFEARATPSTLLSIDFVWSGTTGSGALGSSSIQVSALEPETLTLDLVLDIESLGLHLLSVSALFDTDLENELNLTGVQTLPWTDPTGTRHFDAHGYVSSQESEADREGQIFGLRGLSRGLVPINTTLTFARMVFVTNPSRVRNDGADLVSGFFFLPEDKALYFEIDSYHESEIAFGSASVDVIPEPASFLLLALGIGGLALAARRG